MLLLAGVARNVANHSAAAVYTCSRVMKLDNQAVLPAA